MSTIKLNMVVTDGVRTGYVNAFTENGKVYVMWDMRDGNRRTGGGGNISPKKLQQVGNQYNVKFYIKGVHWIGKVPKVTTYGTYERVDISPESLKEAYIRIAERFNSLSTWSDCTVAYHTISE